MLIERPTRPALLYDGACRFCRFTARCVARLDRGGDLALLPLQDAAAQAFLAELEEDERLSTWRIVQPDGSLTGYGAGVPVLLTTMRLTRPIGRLLGLAPAQLLEALYRVIARSRGGLGRIVPDGPAPHRYP